MVAELDNYDDVKDVYIRGRGLIRNGQNQWFLFNARGDVIALTDATGNVIREYRYDAFGNEVNPCPYDSNPWRFNAEYFDRETGMIYLRMRFYNPRNGRFLNPDPLFWGNNSPDLNIYTIRQTANLYAFVMNNPIRFIDPSGLDAILINRDLDFDPSMGMEHMSMFIQDENDDWWFFFWGMDKVVYALVTDTSIFNSLASIDAYLVAQDHDPAARDRPHHSAVYIRGNFTASHQKALSLFENQNIVNGRNVNYNFMTNNCGHVSMQLLRLGTLPDGTSVASYTHIVGAGWSGSPGVHMRNMQALFYNNATNIDGFNAAMQVQRNKFEGGNAFNQWWHRNLIRNINRIDKR